MMVPTAFQRSGSGRQRGQAGERGEGVERCEGGEGRQAGDGGDVAGLSLGMLQLPLLGDGPRGRLGDGTPVGAHVGGCPVLPGAHPPVRGGALVAGEEGLARGEAGRVLGQAAGVSWVEGWALSAPCPSTAWDDGGDRWRTRSVAPSRRARRTAQSGGGQMSK